MFATTANRIRRRLFLLALIGLAAMPACGHDNKWTESWRKPTPTATPTLTPTPTATPTAAAAAGAHLLRNGFEQLE